MSDEYEPNEGQHPGAPENEAESKTQKAAQAEAAAKAKAASHPVNPAAGDGKSGFIGDKEIPAHLNENVTFEAEITELNEKIMRLAAELENTRRRAQREKVDANRYAINKFALDLLTVADNFERALTAAPEDTSEMSADAIQGLVMGVRMTEKELLKTLERHGVHRIGGVGEKFDPNLHQAVAQAPAAGIPSGHVAQVAQTGFTLGERVLRAAMVIVSTGEPAPAAPTEDAPPTDEDAGGETPGSHVDTSA
ncbi:MAG: nucleotide exchange factor GrpE [Pseudomonadota bacterium]